jgi:hypothetical protein
VLHYVFCAFPQSLQYFNQATINSFHVLSNSLFADREEEIYGHSVPDARLCDGCPQHILSKAHGLLTNSPTKSIELSPFREANGRSDIHIPYLSLNPKVHCRLHKSLTFDKLLGFYYGKELSVVCRTSKRRNHRLSAVRMYSPRLKPSVSEGTPSPGDRGHAKAYKERNTKLNILYGTSSQQG